MKILFVSALLPYPLDSGGQIRMYHLLKRLSTKHDITLCAFTRHADERQYLKNLSFCKFVYTIYRGRAWQPRYIVTSLFGKYPLLLATYNSGPMRVLLSRLLDGGGYDLVHLEPFYVWPGVPKTKTPTLVSEHNIEYEVYREYVRRFPVVPIRPFLSLDTRKLRFWEEYVWQQAAGITAVSGHDEREIKRINRNVFRVPNGVDLNEFVFVEKKERPSAPLFLFTGNFRWLPNDRAAGELLGSIWPAVVQAIPRARLRIVGRHIPLRIRKEAGRKNAEIVENAQTISIHYREADIFIAPIPIAGGTKFKILEAMASGLPVITTPQGVEGIEARDGVHYLAATTPAEYVLSVQKILDDTKLRRKLQKSARLLIEKAYSWDSIANSLDAVWRNVSSLV